jgi:cytochrome c peroxidase
MRKLSLILSLLVGVSFSVPAFAAEATAESIAAGAGTSVADLKEMFQRPAASDIPFPEENTYSAAKYDLGKMLFFDPRLSRSQVTSCATCHNPSFSWGDSLSKGVGDYHKELGRRDPSLLNLAWDENFFWDGRADSLEQQALGPIASEVEMNLPHDVMVARLKGITGYASYFAGAFPGEKDPVTKDNVAKAIATFERKIISGEAPFDKWVKGDDASMEESAKRGFVLFNTKGNCAACHSSWRFSDSSFHDIGINDDDVGRGKLVSGDPLMMHAFKTVGLRNIAERGPYMHNGSVPTLEAVIDHYNDGFVQRESLSPAIQKLNLTADEKKDLVAFLKALSSKDEAVTIPVLPR